MNKAIICDIDGTLAIRNGRGPFEHEKSNTDTLCKEVKNLLDLYKSNGYKIIIFSGRQHRFKDITIKWMEDNDVNYDSIYLRNTDDNRSDSIVKMELYNKHIKNHYDIEFILDDRNQVVDMWRKDLGLKCFQVNYGDF
mgnify:CR=1 FL=1|tara:strand:+ start:267 stop:680 length:414 start_codon:yes stop_codon:yes gene_type:complete